jgi:multisubunit Na+/H+ antiporter MnhE subunit
MRRWLLAALVCGGIYVAVLGSTDPVDLGVGFMIGAAVLLAAWQTIFDPDPPDLPPLWRRVLSFFPWLIAIAREVLRGVFQVSRASIQRHDLPPAGVIEVPLGDRTIPGIGVSALTATLSPGEVLLDVDLERGVMYLHVLDASDPDSIRAAHAELYDRYQRKVMP